MSLKKHYIATIEDSIKDSIYVHIRLAEEKGFIKKNFWKYFRLQFFVGVVIYFIIAAIISAVLFVAILSWPFAIAAVAGGLVFMILIVPYTFKIRDHYRPDIENIIAKKVKEQLSESRDQSFDSVDELTEEGISCSLRGITQMFKWEIVNKVVQTAEYIEIHMDPDALCAIPKRVFAEGELEEWLLFIRRHVRPDVVAQSFSGA